MKFNLFLIFALLSINSYADLNGNLEIIPNTPIKATDVNTKFDDINNELMKFYLSPTSSFDQVNKGEVIRQSYFTDQRAKLPQEVNVIETVSFTPLISTNLINSFFNDIKVAISQFFKNNFIAPDHTSDLNNTTISAQDIFYGKRRILFKDLPNDQVKLTGANWAQQNTLSGDYYALTADGTNQFVEIDFYGTGISLLSAPVDGFRPANVFLYDFDNNQYNSTPDFSNIDTSSNNVAQRNIGEINKIIPLFKDLERKWHRIKIVSIGNAFAFYGVEIQNNMNINYLTDGISSQGGRVIIYEENNLLKKSVINVDSTSLYLSNTDHSNEEVSEILNIRDFGVGSSEDFLNAGTSRIERGYVRSDGTTSLMGNSGVSNAIDGVDQYFISTNESNRYLTLTFKGSGIDLVSDDGQDGFSLTTEAFIDGNSVGNPKPTTIDGQTTIPIASGLPYGTHTLHIINSSPVGEGSFYISDFIIYKPKEPVYNGNKIADYNILAQYQVRSGTGVYDISPGVIRKSFLKEVSLRNGSWTRDLSPQLYSAGFAVGSQNNSFFHDFRSQIYGTGFELRFRGDAAQPSDAKILIDGVELNQTNFPGLTIQSNGDGINLDYISGNVDLRAPGDRNGTSITVSGLPLDHHIIEFNKPAGAVSRFSIEAIDVITPIDIN